MSIHDSSPCTQAIGIGNLQRSRRASNNVGQGNKEPLPQGAQKGRSARPQGATKDDPSKLACLCYPRDSPDESPAARVQRGPSEAARCASTGGSPGHPIPLLADFFSAMLRATIGRRDGLLEHRAEAEVGDGIFEVGIQSLEGSHVRICDVFHR